MFGIYATFLSNRLKLKIIKVSQQLFEGSLFKFGR